MWRIVQTVGNGNHKLAAPIVRLNVVARASHDVDAVRCVDFRHETLPVREGDDQPISARQSDAMARADVLLFRSVCAYTVDV